MSLVITSPAVSNHGQRSRVSSNKSCTRDEPSSVSTAPCTAALHYTASSGVMDLFGSLSLRNFQIVDCIWLLESSPSRCVSPEVALHQDVSSMGSRDTSEVLFPCHRPGHCAPHCHLSRPSAIVYAVSSLMLRIMSSPAIVPAPRCASPAVAFTSKMPSSLVNRTRRRHILPCGSSGQCAPHCPLCPGHV